MSASSRRGYTLIELVVTVLIIGILTSIAVPQYLRTVETGKADDAVAIVNMIGTTNKMFALDHGGAYVTGPFGTDATGACGAAGACPVVPPGAVSGNACDLVWCKYLADQDWRDKPYVYTAIDGTAAAKLTASAVRTGGSPTYNGWGYTVGVSGVISAVPGGSPVSSPPPPTY